MLGQRLGRRPATVPHTPAARPVAPLESIPPPPAKRRATRGASSDGPSVRLSRLQGFALPADGAALNCGVAAYRLTSRPCLRSHPRTIGKSRSGSELPRCHPLSSSFGFAALATGTASRAACLPAGLAAGAICERQEDRDQDQSFHLPPRLVWVCRLSRWLRGLRREGYKAVAVPFARSGNSEAATEYDYASYGRGVLRNHGGGQGQEVSGSGYNFGLGP